MPAPDGAAGSVCFSTPVALRAVDDQGRARVFAGCYVVVQVNPAIQEPPIRPLQIQLGKLALVEAAFAATELGGLRVKAWGTLCWLLMHILLR